MPCRALGRLGARAQESAHFRQEALPGRFLLQQDVILAFQHHKARVGDQCRQQAALFHRDAGILARVQHQRRNAHPRRELLHVDLVKRALHGRSVFGRSRDMRQLVERGHLFGVRLGHQHGAEKLAEGRVLLAPTHPDQVDQRFGLQLALAVEVAVVAPPGIAAVQHQPRNPLGMLHREGHAHRRALRNPQQRKTLQLQRIHHRLQVAHPAVHVVVRHIPVRQARPARVIADQRVRFG